MFDEHYTSSISERIPRIYDSITQTIGNTPLVRLNRLANIAELYTAPLAKVEYFNPAGSIKDRPAYAMLQALIESDDFSPQTEIIEASSGNNGVACAWLCALFNIPLTVVIPEHMSIERQKLIRHYGAQVVTTPKALGTKGAIDEAKRRVELNPHAVSLDQFANQANPNAHGASTAQEIWRDTQGKVDVIVAGIGTGGTLTGLAHTLREYQPNLEVVAVEPARCPVLSEGRSGVHNIQGLSSGHVPEVLDTQCYDRIITVEDEVAIAQAQQLARLEGLAVGISSGATAYAACQLASQPEYRGKNIVVILADGAERYFSTPLFD
ncbi:cysteine synthase [Alteromonas aestuariivivens]|uniref:cysteine synthase n=1 Tax=Alteromonas aestuariivivens TaxID=1938339 RepID=A0A3D8M3P8_9ALTE|nr:cysteine synthase [Alteromonas aestuariivivens]RDV24164.1 cysteine synthase [Alteromonas aestuariivivens]